MRGYTFADKTKIPVAMEQIAKHDKPIVLFVLSLILLLQSLSALVCGTLLMIDPSGASLKLPITVLEHTPFKDFLIPGIFLFTSLGVLPILAIHALFVAPHRAVFRTLNIYANYRSGWMLSLFCGFGTLIWITAQLAFIQLYHWMQTLYALIGILILVLTLWPSMMRYCRVEGP